MSSSNSSSQVGFFVVIGVIVLAGGWFLYQWLTTPTQDPAPSLVEQVESIPGVAQVTADSARIPGSPNLRGTSSQVVFDDTILSNPQASAQRLAAVSRGWSDSSWTFVDLGSTAQVNYSSSLDPAPFAWWLEAVATLHQSDPSASLHCQIGYGSMDCQASGDAAGVREALGALNDAPVQRWIDSSSPDEGQPHGFSVTVEGQSL